MKKIKSFGDKTTEKIYNQKSVIKLPSSIQSTALRKLIMIDNAENINDFRVPPGNHLEKLAGSTSSYSIRVNDKYRICFDLVNDGFENVMITDYH